MHLYRDVVLSKIALPLEVTILATSHGEHNLTRAAVPHSETGIDPTERIKDLRRRQNLRAKQES